MPSALATSSTGMRGDGGEHKRGLFTSTRTCRGELAFGVKGTLAAHGADVDGHIPFHVEDFCFKVGLGDNHQAPGAQLITLEGFAVGANGQTVVDTGLYVAPMRGRECFACQRAPGPGR